MIFALTKITVVSHLQARDAGMTSCYGSSINDYINYEIIRIVHLDKEKRKHNQIQQPEFSGIFSGPMLNMLNGHAVWPSLETIGKYCEWDVVADVELMV